jgi:DNA-binding MarR family transcriptional regulator
VKHGIRARIHSLYAPVVAVNAVYERYAAVRGVGFLDMLVMYEILADDEPYTQSRLCDVLGVSKTTLASVIRRGIDRGDIRLVPSTSDARKKVIELTKQGSKAAHKLIDPLFAMEEKAVRPISDDDIRRMNAMIQCYSDGLSSQIGELAKPDPDSD